MHKEKAKTLLIVATVIWGLLLFPAALMAMISPMIFDAPGSEKNPLAWLLLISVLFSPLAFIGAIISSWICYTRQSYKAAVYCAGAPVVNVLLFFLALVLLQVYSNGSFKV